MNTLDEDYFANLVANRLKAAEVVDRLSNWFVTKTLTAGRNIIESPVATLTITEVHMEISGGGIELWNSREFPLDTLTFEHCVSRWQQFVRDMAIFLRD